MVGNPKHPLPIYWSSIYSSRKPLPSLVAVDHAGLPAVDVLPESAFVGYLVLVALAEASSLHHCGIQEVLVAPALLALDDASQGVVKGKDSVEVVLVKQVAPLALVLEEKSVEVVLSRGDAKNAGNGSFMRLALVAVALLGVVLGLLGLLGNQRLEVGDTPLGDKVTIVGVVLNMSDDVLALVDLGVVEVVGSVSEGVDLELLEILAGAVGEEPVENDAALKATLRVKNENDSVLSGVGNSSSDKSVALSGVGCAEVEASLYETLDRVENDASSVTNVLGRAFVISTVEVTYVLLWTPVMGRWKVLDSLLRLPCSQWELLLCQQDQRIDFDGN